MRYATDSIMQVRLQNEHNSPLGQRVGMTNHARQDRSIKNESGIEDPSWHVSD